MKNLKRFFLLWAIMSVPLIGTFAQVSISDDNSLPDNSAMLHVKSTAKGMLVPRMTIAERNNISNPANGLLVFCTDNNQYYSNKGTPETPNWLMMSSQWENNGPDIYYSLGRVGIGTPNPGATLDVHGMDTDDGGVFRLANSDMSHRLILFGGRENDPNPFIHWKQGDPLRFTTDEGGWSEKMRITSDG